MPAADPNVPSSVRQRAADTPAPKKRQQLASPAEQVSSAKRRRSCSTKTGSTLAEERRSPKAPATLQPASPHLDLLIAAAAAAAGDVCGGTPDQALSSVPGRKVRSPPGGRTAAAAHHESLGLPKSAYQGGGCWASTNAMARRQKGALRCEGCKAMVGGVTHICGKALLGGHASLVSLSL